MKAIVKDQGGASLAHLPRPTAKFDDDVLIDIVCAGVCRTDIAVANGRIPVREPRVLGHEFSGVVRETGDGIDHLKAGAPVTVMPWIGCGTCAVCRNQEPSQCARSQMLGVDRDGAFAEAIVVPARVVYPVAQAVPFCHAAYAEPVAAALAALRADISKTQHGIIWGNNRIAELTRRVLIESGIRRLTMWDPKLDETPPLSAFDFAVEASISQAGLRALISAVRPGGKIVLKSRPAHTVALDVAALVRRELTLRAVHYGSFDQAVQWISEGRIELEDLIGPLVPLSAFSSVFKDASDCEQHKIFLSLTPKGCV